MDPTQRFSGRVENYIKYRPGYPAEVLEFLRRAVGLVPWWTVADIGSGTGILSRMLLENGNRVFGVEPNGPMREAGEQLLAGYRHFHSVNGSAEDTGLKARTINLVTAAQAFHWFDSLRTRNEFSRILVPGGYVVILWNARKTDATPFLSAYEGLLRSDGVDYAEVDHQNVDDSRLRAFFGPGGYRMQVFGNRQVFDWEGLYGRAMSSSYVPGEGHPRHEIFARKLRTLYDLYAAGAKVSFEYDTQLFYGQIS